MRILAIPGSLRQSSYNAALLRAAAQEAPPGVEIVTFDGLREVPAYDEDAEDSVPAAVARLKRAIAEADAVLIATPEYNGSIPGQLKNSLDWVSRPFATNPLRSKPAAVIGASTGLFGAVWAQAELRKVLGTIGADVIDEELPVPHVHDAFTEDGVLSDQDLREALRSRLAQLVELAAGRELAAAA